MKNYRGGIRFPQGLTKKVVELELESKSTGERHQSFSIEKWMSDFHFQTNHSNNKRRECIVEGVKLEANSSVVKLL